VTADSVPDVKRAIDEAKAAGASTMTVPGCQAPLPVDEVEAAIDAFERARTTPPKPSTEPADQASGPAPSPRPRQTLVIKGNIDTVDHHETREERLAAGGAMERPRALRNTVDLRSHQVAGVARLQHLFKASPEHCRGVLLADDMGLGKTLQLLAFLAWAHEQNPDLPPSLVVAPVSLLENWQEEIARFFEPGSLRVLTAYGDAMAPLRVPRASIDAELQREGLVRFLRPEWRGDAQVVLTTYETLRDLEFTFAKEPWSILVCDEAQKIKNPNALVTRAVKKLNVRFRVACTGTPVENSLTDLWCLFDMVQPGLLGALNTFGREFGRVIEGGSDTDKVTQLEKLRSLIDPQVIRRTKADVAKDLPKKIPADGCQLPMSNEQRALYVGAVQRFGSLQAREDATRMHHLALLRYLRLICADPRPLDVDTFVPDDPDRYYRKAPKMHWLMQTLCGIQGKREKALVFAEDREVQRLLQHYISADFGFAPRIVNGDTSVSAKSNASRQRIVAEFQSAPGFGVLILSPLAAGFGLNIQGANHVIHYLRHWNPAKEDQATDRAYRIGQTRDVAVYCPLIVAGDFKTFDVKLDELLARKRALAVDMLQGTGAVAETDFDLREIVPGVELGTQQGFQEACPPHASTAQLAERSYGA
jgi:SNF2 family DNA or RNA helicase